MPASGVPASISAFSANAYVAKSDLDTATPRPYIAPSMIAPP